jgi:hypothetical protein
MQNYFSLTFLILQCMMIDDLNRFDPVPHVVIIQQHICSIAQIRELTSIEQLVKVNLMPLQSKAHFKAKFNFLFWAVDQGNEQSLK